MTGAARRTLEAPRASPDGASLAVSLADVGLCVALAVSVIVTFLPALGAQFVGWDDPLFVTENPSVRGLTGESMSRMWRGPHGGHYHPITTMSWALDYQIAGGYRPFTFHLTSVLLHALNAVLAYWLLRAVLLIRGGSETARWVRWGAAAGAALFALHPLRVESVAWVTERRDVLSAAFLLGATICYLRSARPGEARLASGPLYIASVGLLLLSCLSKAWGMTFFAIALVLDWWPLHRIALDPRTWASRGTLAVVAQKLPMVVIGVLTAWMAARAVGEANSPKTLAEWSVADRAVQAVYGVWFYASRTVWPGGLSPLYALPVHLNPLELRFVAAYIGVGAGVAMLMAGRRHRGAIAGAAMYLICLAPVLGAVQSGEQFVADRYSYLACVPIAGMLAFGVRIARQRWRAGPDDAPSGRFRVAIAGVVVAVLVLAVGANLQTHIWRDTMTLWRHAAATSPNEHVLTHLAGEQERAGDRVGAARSLAAALEINPDFGRVWFIVGNTLRDQGHYPEAEQALRNAARTLPQAFMAHVNLGSLYLNNMNRPVDAIAAFRAAVADVERGGARPLSALPYVALGSGLRRTGAYAEARKVLTRALAFEEARASAEKELAGLSADEAGGGSR